MKPASVLTNGDFRQVSQCVCRVYLPISKMSIIIKMHLPGLLWWGLNEIIYLLGFPGGAVVKNLPTNAETQVGSLGQNNPLEEKMTAGVPVFLPGESHGQRTLVSYSLWGRKQSDKKEHRHTYRCYNPLRTERLEHSNIINVCCSYTFMHWRRKWQPTPVFLPGESRGQRSLVGCCLWGRTESDTTEAT